MNAVSEAVQRLTLDQGLHGLNLSLYESQKAQLIAYLALIQKWTQVYNLTSVRDPAEMLTHHLLDSLAVIRLTARPG